ncbi:MAG: C45 family peptidase [Patescibacteria group bacterium]|nr:C45 family peptidase [Patescibacteria group bacterium]
MRISKKSGLLLFIVAFSVGFCFISSVVAFENDSYESNYAEWRFSNGQPYLYVSADSYYTLGYLEGQNLAFQTAWMKLMIMLQAEQIGFSYDIAVYYALDYLDYIPEEYILEMNGIADAIDYVLIPFMSVVYNITIDFLDVLAQNTFWDIYYGKIVPMLSGYPQPPLISAGCTAIGSNTGKKAILGQTIDISLLMQPTASWVYTKIQGKKVFSFRTGSMLAMGGVNKRGLAISVNLLEVLNIGSIGKPLSVIYRSALENAKNVRQAKNIILDNDFTLGWNFIIRDKRHVVAIETIPNSYSFERTRKGSYTFDANIYENPYFKMFMIYPTKYVERYNRVSELCQTYSQDGKLDINDLFEIYSDTLISRRYTSPDPLSVGTAGSFFVDTKNNVYFSLGNPLDSTLGVISSFN